jgi:protein tyrosine phosphatase
LQGYKLRRAYIATQGPLSETVNDMWRMIWENDCKCIVMLCQTMEQGLESSHCFWPPTVGEEKVYGNIRVWLKKESVHRDITERRLEVEGGMGGVTKMVTLLQLTSWPPGHLPLPKSILSLVELLSKAQRSCSSRHTTVICSDGMGRTGTFICLHSQLERLKTEGVVDFLQAVKSARIQRPGLVTDAAHYAFCHEVVAAYVDSFETYANFKELV